MAQSQPQLADGLKRVLDAYVAGVTLPTPGAARHGRSNRRATPWFDRLPEARLMALIQAEFGTLPTPGDDATRAEAGDGRPKATMRRPSEVQLFGGVPVYQVLELLAAAGAGPDTLAIARRVARYMKGSPERLWQYVAVSVTPTSPVTMYGGWELAPIDLVRDEKLPLSYRDHEYRYSPGAFHLEYGYGALRHPSGEGDVPDEESESDEPALTLPLLALNLVSDHPVHVGVSYYVDPGRDIALPPGVRPKSANLFSHPRELHKWDYVWDQQVHPRGSRTLDAETTAQFGRFASELGGRLLSLDKHGRERLIRAADQYLIMVHRTPASSHEAAAAVPAMHESEAAFRWISAIEGLLAAGDNDRSDLTRKTAQRAAVLIGQDDAERLATRDLMRHAYAARSAYAHGGSPKRVDLAALRTITRKVIVAWIVLSAASPRKPVTAVLDDALLSARTRDEALMQPLKRFSEQAEQ